MEHLGNVRRRIKWAAQGNEAATNKLLTLLSGLEFDRALWEEITQHMADTQSHLRNALGYLPDSEAKTDWEALLQDEARPPDMVRSAVKGAHFAGKEQQ